VGDGEAHGGQAIDDSALVAQARGGDDAAFELLMRRHFRVAFAIARAHTRSETDAEDVCQNAFLRAHERLRDCSDPARFAGWLLRIVRNQAINWREREDLRAAAPLDDARDIAGKPAERPDVLAERRELRQRLTAALATLSVTQREIVILHDVEGRSHGEIAALLALSEGMSRRHLSDARKRLRVVLNRGPEE
jgi:RNA polymerase sigma-70 factor (ECF subfamily)